MNQLELPNEASRLWEAFQSGGELDAPAAAPELLARWQRSRALGIRPTGTPEATELVRGGALLGHLARSDDLLAAASAVLSEAASLFTHSGYSLLLTDDEGVILQSVGGGEFLETARRLHLIEGGRWSEAVQGTNAIGTALTEGQPTAVLGAAHFVRSNHGLVCYAAPIHDPYGHVVGILDATSWAAAAHEAISLAVLRGATRIAAALRSRAWSVASARLAEGLLQRCPTPAVLVEWPGTVRALNAAARTSLCTAGEGLDLTALTGLRWADLVDAARDGRAELDIDHWGGEAAPGRVSLQPIDGHGGPCLGVVLFISPRPSAPSRGRGMGDAQTSPPRGTLSAPGARRLGLDPSLPPAFDLLKGEDPVLRETKGLAARLAPRELPLLLLAETGTGKGLLARAIHETSRRAGRPLLHINCGALSPHLLESELFGYGPGAFTGARREGQDGKLHQAHGGTLFLDEVAEMSTPLQAMLLKVLEEGTYFRVGESVPRRADFRLICATCQDLPARVKDGRFREDLYYRIRGAVLTLPPLRERADLGPLAAALLLQLAEEEGGGGFPTEIDDDAARALAAHPWPGNVRELRMTLHGAAALSDGRRITLADLPQEVRWAAARSPLAGGAELEATKEASLLRELRASAGNVSEAARRLGIARSTVYRMMTRFGLTPGSRAPR